MYPAHKLAVSLLFFASGQVKTSPDLAVYRNDALHLTYTYPSEFKLSPRVAEAMQSDTQARVPDAYKTSINCVTTPFAAEHRGAFNSMEALFIIRSDDSCLKNDEALKHPRLSSESGTLAEIARGALIQGLINFPSPIILPAVSYKLGTHNASFVQGSGSTGPTRSGYSGVACVAVDHNTVCWAIFTPLKSRLNALLATTVTFSSEPETSIVPPDLLP